MYMSYSPERTQREPYTGARKNNLCRRTGAQLCKKPPMSLPRSKDGRGAERTEDAKVVHQAAKTIE